MDWDNLRVVLVLAETGSITSAARLLGVNRTTVLRRVNAFEKQLDYRLFERSEAGYVMTVEASEILAAARELKGTIADLERRVEGRELRLEGEIRVTTTDALLSSTVAPHLASFGKLHPDITLELSVTNHRLSLTKRDADVAIRPTPKPPESLVGRKLHDIRFALYAAPAYLEDKSDFELDQHRWLAVDEPLTHTPAGLWLKANVANTQICYRADSFVALKLAAENGLGVTILPRALGDLSGDLTRLGRDLPGVKTGLWILTHPDLLRSARIHALFEHFTNALSISTQANLGT
jgi:DNA-binding transcriptional LysR family regulator